MKPGLDINPRWVTFKEDNHDDEEAQKQELLEEVEVLGDLGAMTDIGAPTSGGESSASDLGATIMKLASEIPGFEERRAELEANKKARAQTPEQREAESEEIREAWRAHNEEQYWKYKDALDESGSCTSDGLSSMKGRGRGRGSRRWNQTFQRHPLVA